MPEDSLIIVAAVISVVIFIELIVAIILCIKFSKKRFGWFDCKICKLCECTPCDCCEIPCLSHKKLHRYKIRKLSIQTSSSKSESRSASVNNQINWILPFPFKSQQQQQPQQQSQQQNSNQLFTIETNSQMKGDQNLQVHDEMQKTIKTLKSNKNRMNSYLYAINYRNIINEIEKENFYKKSIMLNKSGSEYKFNIDDNMPLAERYKLKVHDTSSHQNDIETTSTANLNTESPLTDVSIPSPPSSLNLVSLSRCPSPPAPLSRAPYIIKSDFESIESDETNQLRNMFRKEKAMLNHTIAQDHFLNNSMMHDNNNNNTSQHNRSFQMPPANLQNTEASLLSSINFIKFYLDKFDTKITNKSSNSNNLMQINNAINSNHNNNNQDDTNRNMKILNDYLSKSNTEEIIESTIELIQNFKPVVVCTSNEQQHQQK